MTTKLTQQNKTTVWAFWQELSATPADQLGPVVQAYVHEASAWWGPHPLNDLHGRAALITGFWQPLRRAVPDLRRTCHVFLGGAFAGQEWVCATGYFTGTFAQPWLGIPATGGALHIRFGEFCRVQAGKIVEDYLLLDLIDVMRQAGFRVLPRSRGDEATAPGPRDDDGVLLAPQDARMGRQSLRLVEAMLAGLRNYDGADLRSMHMAAFWQPDMHWYGPCGIGAARSLAEYEAVHARPFLQAFPDRKGGHHKARLAEGRYVASTGWPSVRATHHGAWLGSPPTGKPIGMRVMDFWRREGDRLAQNWVLIDIIDIFQQGGIDLFNVLRQQVAARSGGLACER